MVHHTGLYLAVRTDVFRWILLTPDIDACLPYVVGVTGPPEMLHELGLAARQDRRDDALAGWATAFVGTPVFSHLFYAALSLGAMLLLLRRRRSEDIAIAGLQAAALLFTLSFLAIGIACDYRYLYALDLA